MEDGVEGKPLCFARETEMQAIKGFVRNPEEKKPFGKSWRRWEDNGSDRNRV
jgi:hypothetical protein